MWCQIPHSAQNDNIATGSLLLLDVDAVQSEESFRAYNKAVAHVVIK